MITNGERRRKMRIGTEEGGADKYLRRARSNIAEEKNVWAVEEQTKTRQPSAQCLGTTLHATYLEKHEGSHTMTRSLYRNIHSIFYNCTCKMKGWERVRNIWDRSHLYISYFWRLSKQNDHIWLKYEKLENRPVV